MSMGIISNSDVAVQISPCRPNGMQPFFWKKAIFCIPVSWDLGVTLLG